MVICMLIVLLLQDSVMGDTRVIELSWWRVSICYWTCLWMFVCMFIIPVCGAVICKRSVALQWPYVIDILTDIVLHLQLCTLIGKDSLLLIKERLCFDVRSDTAVAHHAVAVTWQTASHTGAMTAWGWSRGMAPLTVNLTTRWKWEWDLYPGLLTAGEKCPFLGPHIPPDCLKNS